MVRLPNVASSGAPRRGLCRAGVRVGHGVHSGELRAEQTARLLVGEIGAEASVEARAGFAPNDPVAPTAQWLRGVTEHQALALVGHLPFLDRLASLLVAGNEDAQLVHFRMGRFGQAGTEGEPGRVRSRLGHSARPRKDEP
jgi:phosphohistidine phosphatase SixA